MLAAVLLMVFFAFATLSSLHQQPVTQEYLYRVEDLQQAEALGRQYGLELLEVSPARIARYLGNTAQELELLAEGFALNGESRLSAPPWQSTTDPYLRDQYALSLTYTTNAWGLTTGSSAVVVAIIDTGIDTDHGEFTGRILASSYNAVTKEVGIAKVEDDYGHGTMVAGVIGAIKDNAKGIAGIAQNVGLLVIKANKSGEGSFQDAAIIEGIYYAVESGANIINLSLGSAYGNPLTKAAVAHAIAENVIVVAAAGNDGSDELIYPASFPDVISVSAVDSDALVADFSNFGSEIDMAAPGAEIITTARDNGYVTVSGTSFASPQVSGILALLISYEQGITVTEMKTRLFQTAQDKGATGRDDYYGFGIVHAYNLLTAPFAQIAFVSEPGTSFSPIWVKTGTKPLIDQVPEYPEHIFLGWYLDSSFTTPFVSGVTTITADTTLYARYTSEYNTITYMVAGEIYSQQAVPYGETVVLPAPAITDYRFEGWYLDEEFQAAYQPAPLFAGLVLYGKVIPYAYYDVSLSVLGAITDVITHREDAEPALPEISLPGYTFGGWYLDADFDEPYDPLNDFGDITLYAKLERIYLTVTLVVDQDETQTIQVAYGETLSTPDPEQEGAEFAGWYLDAACECAYLQAPITANLTLYARFATSVYQVRIMIDGAYAYAVFLEYEEPFTHVVERVGYVFAGFFTDSEYTLPFTDATITEDTTLYAKLERQTFTVRFHDAAGSLFLTQTVFYGEDLTPPAGPTKASTNAFVYDFQSWSESLADITANLDVYPLYQAVFQPGSVQLNPGIDTIQRGTPWIDAGLTMSDPTLTVVTTNPVDASLVGRYTVTYAIMHQETIVYTYVRIVNVREETPLIVITLNKGVSTLKAGETYVEAGARTTYGTIATSGTVDTATPGVYKITYRVLQNGFIYEKSRYIFVIAADATSGTLVWYFREDDGDEA